eukprot:COSAG06_NODE_1766_length_8438_cov_16.148099_3_plen_113_part_00
MYGSQGDTEQQHKQKEKKEEHSARVTMLWSRFKEELAKGQAPSRMMPINAKHVLERRRVWRNAGASAVEDTDCATTSNTTSSAANAQKKAQLQNSQIEKIVTLAGRMSSVSV